MNSPRLPRFLRRKNGSALLTVMIFTTVMVIMVASILGWSVNERRLNTRSVYWNESRNAAESLCEYGAAQITYMCTTFDQAGWPTMDPAVAIGTVVTNLPLQLPLVPGTTVSVFNNGNTTATKNQSDIDTHPLSSTHPNGLELIGGQFVKVFNKGQMDYIDPTIQENANDPFNGLLVHRWDAVVMAKATAVPPNGSNPVNDYVKETISVRGAPLFNFFIFYAINDLEIYPGANMTITGPVHSNNDIYLSPTGGISLTFNGIVSASGNIFHDQENSADGQTVLDNSPVYFQGPSGSVNMYNGSKWDDSTMGADNNPTVFGPDTPPPTSPATTPLQSALNKLMTPTVVASFKNYATATWPNNVLTSAMGVITFNPTGFNEPLALGPDFADNQYLPDSLYVDSGDQVTVTNGIASPYIDHHVTDPTTSPVTTAKGNVSYINDPPDSDFNINATTGTYYYGRKGLEMTKYANLANLYILVNVTAGTPDTAKITYYGPYNETHLGATGYGPNGGVFLGTANYDITTYTTLAGTSVPHTQIEPQELVSFVPYVLNGTTVTQGLYDQHESKPVDLVQIDMMALNLALADVNAAILNNQPQPCAPSTDNSAIININGPYTTAPGDNIWGSGVSTYNNNAADNTGGQIDSKPTSGGWNGVIYVDVEGTPTAGTLVAVGLGNGQTTVQSVNSNPVISNSLNIANVTAPITAPLQDFTFSTPQNPVPSISNTGSSTIAWGPATGITGDANLLTSGTYFDAFLTNTTKTSSLTADGITFNFKTSTTGTSGSDVSAGKGISFSVTTGSNQSYVFATFPTAAPSSSAFAAIMNSGGTYETGGNGAGTVTISGLTSGHTYSIQVFNYANDGDPGLTQLSGSPSVTLNNSPGNGTYTTGTFTASGTTESFNWTGEGSSYTVLGPISVRDLGTNYPILTNLIPNNPNLDTSKSPAVPFLDSRVGRDSSAPINGSLVYPVGLSVATNVPLYIEGNFNADGSIDTADPVVNPPNGTTITGSSNLPDDTTAYNSGTGAWTPSLMTTFNSRTNTWSAGTANGTAEAPVAIVADAISFLSPTYFGGTANGQGKPPTSFVFPTGNPNAPNPNPVSGLAPNQNAAGSNASKSKNTASPTAGETIEVAAAVVAGIRPTDSSAGSGGVHNFPRFLEGLSGSPVLIRGSLVNLYASKFATGKYGTNYYTAPERHWGYDYLFESGVFPPATPNAWSVRRMNFNDLSAAQYSALRIDPVLGYPGDASYFTPVQ